MLTGGRTLFCSRFILPPSEKREGGSGRTTAVKGRVIYSKSRFATTNLRLTELLDSWAGMGRYATDRRSGGGAAAVFAVVTGDGAELQGRFVIVPPVFN